jgi:pyrimidine oxygenase
VKFGLFLPGGTRGHIMSDGIAPPGEPTYEYHKRLVVQSEALGYEFALAAVKFRGMGGRTRYWEDYPDSFTLIAGLAEATDRITLYASCSTLAYPPALTAKMSSTLSEMSDGRCGLNLVTGWYKREYEMMGPWPGDSHYANRYDQATEYVTVVRQLWTEGRSDFKGEFFQMDDCRHGPVPKHDIPIVCAGGSPRGMRFTANMADIAFLGPSSWDTLDTQLAVLDAEQKAAGRRVSAYVTTFVVIGDTDEEAEQIMARIQAGTDWQARATAMGQASADPKPTPGSVAETVGSEAANAPFMGNMALHGSPETVAAEVDRLAQTRVGDTGVEGFVICFVNYLEDAQRFMSDVVPLMKHARPSPLVTDRP